MQASRYHQGFAVQTSFLTARGGDYARVPAECLIDFGLTGEKDEDVARRLIQMDLQGRLGRSGHDVALMIVLRVNQLHLKHPAWYSQHRTVPKIGR